MNIFVLRTILIINIYIHITNFKKKEMFVNNA